ncbi:SDR family NAD(P)-dependent oxidoreductase [Polyangium mundeleinium]|uniref:SDR family NAD(P)-dependent oxidoreductase n=1 Tax=Polyangium mundeleinium TaxID=2995306 RepID=A0ABT5ET51_9BACT|nr:SDR family NAD(P)-dependent oxidoreductase [Polyangium mundeleinium]MDC0744378.1 SDR family NAD(P)-dependent oxidoreductase [Polyangium mundeleinium]
MGRIEGKVALVTGATGGIGRATIDKFVREGARVFAFARQEAPLRDAVAHHGASVAMATGDITEEADVARAVAACLEAFGRLDIVFANAGVEGVVKPITDVTAEELDEVYRVNVRGTFFTLKHSAPPMVKQGKGSIIVNSSVLGLSGMAGLSAYAMSKHAVTGLMRSAALELSPLGVRVNSIHPAAVDNRMMRSIERLAAPDAPNSVKDKFTSMIPLGRYGTNEEIADLVLFLGSDESSFCSGSTFTADGAFGAL